MIASDLDQILLSSLFCDLKFVPNNVGQVPKYVLIIGDESVLNRSQVQDIFPNEDILTF